MSDSRFSLSWIPSILCYSISSISMTLINKFVLFDFKYKLPNGMLFVQAVICLILLQLFAICGMIKYRSFKMDEAKAWFPVCILYTLMLYTGSKCLQYLAVPVVTIYKNISIILIAFGEAKIFGGRVTLFMLISFFCMILSSVVAAGDDILAYKKSNTSNLGIGYIWMLLNVVASSSFVLFMRYSIKSLNTGISEFKDFDTVFYNNLLGSPLFLGLCLFGADANLKEAWDFYSRPENVSEYQQLVNAMLISGIFAFFISLASSWCMRVTNSTTYSMVGALSKLPLSILGISIFKDKELNVYTVSSIALGFVSGVLYTMAKLQYDAQRLQTVKDERVPLK
jgi:GDP-mannose transporter